MTKTLGTNSSPTYLSGKHSSILDLGRKRRALGAPAALVILALIVAGVVMVFVFVPAPHQTTIPIVGGTTTTNTSSVAASCSGLSPGLITLNFGDGLAGGSTTPTTVKVVPDAGVQVGGQTYSGRVSSETVTISSGTGNTADQYPCGAGLSIYEVLSGSETLYSHMIAPGATQAQIQGKNWPAVNFYTFTNPTISISVEDDKGNFPTSGTTIENFTNSGHCTTNNNCLGESSITFTIQITDTVSNSGYASSYDPINQQNWCNALQVKEGGTNVNIVGVSGFPSVGGTIPPVGTVRYWQSAIPDGLSLGAANPISSGSYANLGFSTNCAQYSTATGGLSTQKQGSTNIGGTVTLKITVSQGSLAHGNTLSLAFQDYTQYDPAYAFSNSASGGTNAATLGSAFTLKIGA